MVDQSYNPKYLGSSPCEASPGQKKVREGGREERERRRGEKENENENKCKILSQKQ
jgi:hypothetical protein